jgi:hypothetical protein
MEVITPGRAISFAVSTVLPCATAWMQTGRFFAVNTGRIPVPVRDRHISV